MVLKAIVVSILYAFFTLYGTDYVSGAAEKSLFYGKRLVGVSKSDYVIPAQYM